MSDRSDLSPARAVTEVAQGLKQARTLEETLHAVARAALETAPGCDHAAVTVVLHDGTTTTVAGTGPLVDELHEIEARTGEGPGTAVLQQGESLVVEPTTESGSRWPAWAAGALEAGLCWQLSLRLAVDGGTTTVGALHLYSTSTGTTPSVAGGAERVAQLLAGHATLAATGARELAQLREALRSRKVIGQALGLLMERYSIDEDRAFDYLVRHSSTENVRLRVVAQGLVADAEAAARRD